MFKLVCQDCDEKFFPCWYQEGGGDENCPGCKSVKLDRIRISKSEYLKELNELVKRTQSTRTTVRRSGG